MRRRAVAADLDIVVLVLAVGHIGGGRLGIAASSFSSAAPAPPSAASISGIVAFSVATSAFSASAAAASLRAIAAPISFEAALRRSCAFCNSPIAARRWSSSAISVSRARRQTAPREAGVEGRGIVADRLDVMHGSPDPIVAAQSSALAEHGEARAPPLPEARRQSSNGRERFGEDNPPGDHADDRHQQREGRDFAAEWRASSAIHSPKPMIVPP